MSKGFTLVELLIYLAIVSVALTAMVRFSLVMTDARNKNFVIQEVQANSRNAILEISRIIKDSTDVNVPGSEWDIDPGELRLTRNDSLLSPTIIRLDGDNGNLEIVEGLNPPVRLTSNKVRVSNLVFSNFSGDNQRETIKVELTVEYNNSTNDVDFDYSQSLQTSVGLRQ